ncbi:MAG: sigma-70 family RNA polymerase sigma factor [Caldilineaceae bacterium]|nr:sigma-70 family RNA polymerase sigma factor [Caldilineaceae bacterium]
MSDRLLNTDAAATMTELSEEELLSKAKDFGGPALSELYDRYETKIFTYIYRRTGEQALAEDLTAQVFLKMLEAIRKGNAWQTSFSGWLYRIAHNIVIDYYRRRERQSHVSIDEAPTLTATEHNPVQTAEMNMDVEQLQSAIQRLTDEQGQVVSLRFLDGYSIAEVAEMLDKTEGAIKALQYRAVASLRQILLIEQQ